MKALLNIEATEAKTVEALEKAIVSILNTHGNTWGELWLKRKALQCLKESATPVTNISNCNFTGK
jgi:hypothetical protein